MTTGSDALPRLLAELRALVPTDDGPVIDELERRLGHRVLRVLVAGEAKRGKSTLVNALLGRDVLPTGVVPVTAVATTVRAGTDERVVVRFADGTTRAMPLSALPDLVTECGNPANARGVDAVEVRLPVPLLEGVELVDTPGVGSVHAHNTAAAQAALRSMDAAVFVLTADPPISASERVFLRDVRGQAVRVFCVLNKVDRLDPAELGEALAFTRQVVAAELGTEVAVFPLSARAGRAAAGADPGFQTFLERFRQYLADESGRDLCRSIAGHAARLARSTADGQRATLGALAVSDEDLEERLSRFRAALAAVHQQATEAAAVAAAEFRRMRATIDQRAAALVARETPPLVRAAAEAVETAEGPASAVEATALAAVAARIRELVGDWREAQAGQLQAAVRDLDRRLGERLTGQIQAVRDTAAALFAVPMPALPPAAQLVPAARFDFWFAPDPGQIDLLTTAIRTRLPGRLARRRIAAHVTDRAAELLDRHVGRSAAAFRSQLAETERGLARERDRRFAHGAGRIAAAIETAARLRAEEQPRVAEARRRAEGILREATELVVALDRLADAPVAAPGGQRHREPTTI